MYDKHFCVTIRADYFISYFTEINWKSVTVLNNDEALVTPGLLVFARSEYSSNVVTIAGSMSRNVCNTIVIYAIPKNEICSTTPQQTSLGPGTIPDQPGTR